MVATRSLQLTVKKTTRVQKTLEGQLLMIKDGERTAISSRVAELDQILPQYLGVSKAILDSVIFCHQDESLWPMSEPSALKKKFDEIFEALKYTKAIDNIKQLRKKQNEELAKYKIMEQHSKEDKDRADRAEKLSQELSDEIEQLRTETKDLNRRAQEAGAKSQEAWNLGAKYEHVVESLKLGQEKQDWLQKNVDELSQDLNERTESDEWLQNEVDQYEQRMAVHEEHKQQQTKQYETLKRIIEQGREKLQIKHIEAGKHEEQKANHELQIERRNVLVRETARQHNIRGYETDLDDAQIREYTERISKLYKDQNAAVLRIRRDTEREMRKSQDILSKLGERKSALSESKSSTKQQSISNDRKIVSLQSELSDIEIDEGGRAILEANIEDLEFRLKKSKDELEAASWESKLQESNTKLRLSEDETEQLNIELVQGTKQVGDLAKLEHLKSELKTSQRSIDTMIGAHNERLQSIVGQKWHPSSLEGDFQNILDRRSRQVEEAERRRNDVSRKLEQVEFQLMSVRAELKKGEKDLENCVQIIRGSTQGEPDYYTEDLKEMQTNRDTLKADVDNYSNLRKYYSDSIKYADKHEKCKLCSRRFHADQDRRLFIEEMEKKIARNTMDDIQKQLREMETELQEAKNAGPSHDTWLRLSETELPRLRIELRQFEESRGSLLQEVEEHDNIVNDLADAKRDAETLSKPVASILKYSHDINSFKLQSQELAAKQKDAGLTRTLEDIQEQLKLTGGKSRSIREGIAKMTVDKERARTHVNTLELDLSKARNNLTTANHQLEKKAGIFAQIEDLRKVNHEHWERMKRLDEQIQSLAPQIAEEEAKLDDIKQRGATKEKELQQEATRLSDSVHRLTLAHQSIQAYLDAGGSDKLASCRREIDSAQQEIGRTEKEQKQIIIEINRISDQLRNHQETKRTIVENIKYRRSLLELESVKEKIAKLSAQNAEADFEHYKKEASYWQHQYKLHSTAETSKLGTMKAKDDQLMQLLNDWNTDYKDAAFKYKESHIKVETTKAAVEDLGRYGGALDKAIMKYHSIKMEEINRIIEELWKRTYQGTDVDTISIRSDNETAKGNRSYNYRVCMAKQDAEMDMRGRCSAGQKVLASIIIRLALAECFGVNCGLIALDEPTTNLDRDNIRSLAESLHQIIKERQQQSNFQLIVITHDEDFLKYMKCADFCDTYYRVSRNDRQKSIIERQSIAEVL